MKASPLAQYLQQKNRAGGRRMARAFAATSRRLRRNRRSPRQLAVAQRRSAPGARRSLAPIRGARAAPEDEAAPRRNPALFRPRESAPPPPPPPDIENRLSEAYHRGVQEGLDAARAEAATSRAMERAEVQKRAVVERLDFQMNEYAKLAEAVAAGHDRSRAANRRRRSRASCSRSSRRRSRIRSSRNSPRTSPSCESRDARVSCKIRGPEKLLDVLKEKISTMAVDVEYVAEDGIEITVEAQHTTISPRSLPGPS